MALKQFALIITLPVGAFEVHSIACKVRIANTIGSFHRTVLDAIQEAPVQAPVTVMPCTKGACTCTPSEGGR